ncbi:MAG: hypothetical protein CVT64_01430 [Actinobacteria bacterium HGW-Actinobacteria-4]|nr:MAG: hypothetical protein CVT64_01430 [Actinobacteria bacterium HGW-Actinobacteria-4]
MRRFRLLTIAALGVLALTACGEELVIPSAAVGDCLQSSDLESSVAQFSVVECDTSHDAEVFALVDLAHSGEFDATTIIDESNAACLARFESYVGIDYNESVLLIRPVHPTQITWDAGDRQTVCVVTSPEMVTESFASSEI